MADGGYYGKKFDENIDEETDTRINYGLRENPKKTWRAEINSRICKQCGKGFQSMKALCGHMASHSEKEKIVKDDVSWTTETQKSPPEYSCSDSEKSEGKQIRIRSSSSKPKRYKKFIDNSSPVSEIDGQDQEEVAMCLMLLSRDFASTSNESSDNNSVILETNKSSSNEKGGKDGGISDSDSGYFLDECKAESGLSVNGFRRYMASFFGEGSEKDESRKYECYNCKKVFKSYQALGGHRPCHKRTLYESGENSLDDSADYSRKKASIKKTKATANGDSSNSRNKSKNHVCPFCDRVFKNGQALGGHKRSHFIGGGNLENGGHTRAKGRGLLDLNLPAPEDEGF